MGLGVCNMEKNRKNEVEIVDSDIHQIDSFLYEVCPSICKIIFLNGIGTGFLIKLYKEDKPSFF